MKLSLIIDMLVRENRWIYTKEKLINEYNIKTLPTDDMLKSFDSALIDYDKFKFVVYAESIHSLIQSAKLWAKKNDYEIFAKLSMDSIPVVWLGEGYYGIYSSDGKAVIMPVAFLMIGKSLTYEQEKE